MLIGGLAFKPGGFSRVRNRPSCRSIRRPNLNYTSTLKLRNPPVRKGPAPIIEGWHLAWRASPMHILFLWLATVNCRTVPRLISILWRAVFKVRQLLASLMVLAWIVLTAPLPIGIRRRLVGLSRILRELRTCGSPINRVRTFGKRPPYTGDLPMTAAAPADSAGIGNAFLSFFLGACCRARSSSRPSCGSPRSLTWDHLIKCPTHIREERTRFELTTARLAGPTVAQSSASRRVQGLCGFRRVALRVRTRFHHPADSYLADRDCCNPARQLPPKVPCIC